MKPLTLVPTSTGALLFDRRDGQLDAYTAAAAKVLHRLLDEAAFDVVAGAPPWVSELVQRLVQRAALDGNGHLQARCARGAGALLPPITLHVEISGVCNLDCTHCFAAPLPRTSQALTRDELCALFNDATELGVCRLSLTGGEPLLRRDLLDIVDDAAAAGLAPSLVTNGLIHDLGTAEALAARLRDHRLLWLSVSLDGATATTNDAIRGVGVFARVVERLALLRTAGAPFSIAFTVHPALVDEVDACVALARDVGAEAAIFRPLYPVGAARTRPEMWLSREQWDLAVARVEAAGGTVAADDEHGAALFPADACAAGFTQASIGLDGRVSPCGFLGAAHDGPSVRDVPLSTSWAMGATFRDVRDHGGSFDGGCRARSQAAYGSALARDPWRRGLPILR